MRALLRPSRLRLHQASSAPEAPSAPGAPQPAVVTASFGLEGVYDHAAYGALQVARAGEDLRLAWRGNEWPLRFVGPREAAITVAVFGLEIPLPVTFGDGRVEIPFALDPRVALQAFVRTSRPAGGKRTSE